MASIAIRQDTRLATQHLLGTLGVSCKAAEKIHHTYNAWLESVTTVLCESLGNSTQYEIFPSDVLHSSIIKLGENHAEKQGYRPFFVSLDDAITLDLEEWDIPHLEIGFSRLYGLDGEVQDFVARPTMDPLDEQLRKLKKAVDRAYYSNDGNPVGIILLEDNVRRAKTLNWIIEKMAKAGVFENARGRAVSSCFSCATKEEREKLVYDGQPIPILTDYDFAGKGVDVKTPRDLLFDGAVVEISGADGQKVTRRLPHIFMENTANVIGVSEEILPKFMVQILNENIKFCKKVRNIVGFEMPLEAFAGGEAIQSVHNFDLGVPMIDVLGEAFDKYVWPCPELLGIISQCQDSKNPQFADLSIGS